MNNWCYYISFIIIQSHPRVNVIKSIVLPICNRGSSLTLRCLWESDIQVWWPPFLTIHFFSDHICNKHFHIIRVPRVCICRKSKSMHMRSAKPLRAYLDRLFSRVSNLDYHNPFLQYVLIIRIRGWGSFESQWMP